MTYTSTSKSQSIQDIENKYNINLSTCTKEQLNLLTLGNGKKKAIHTLSDLMLNTKKFDLANMTDIERINLKYLVMSTDEVLDVLRRKASSIYYKPAQTRLRSRMTFEDFYQSCAYKVMLNDGILRFDANYKLEPAMHCWLLRNAMWMSYKKAGHEDDMVILDAPVGHGTSGKTAGERTTMLDLISAAGIDPSCIDYKERVSLILSKMSKEASDFIVLKAGNTQIPMSEYNIAKLFIIHHLGKKELSRIMYNTKTSKLVSNQIFNKFYKQTLMHIVCLLQDEAEFCGERFDLDKDEL